MMALTGLAQLGMRLHVFLLAQEKLLYVIRTVETCEEKGRSLSNAWFSAES